MFRQWRRGIVHKKIRCPSYQIKRLDNGANFGSLRPPPPSPRQYRQKARKARRRDVLSLIRRSFPAVAQRWWILFLRASYFRSRYNKVPPFDKTSSHEFPATWENVNTEGRRARRRMWKKAPFTELTESTRGYFVSRGKRSKIFPYVGNLVLQGVSDYRPFQCDDWNIWRPDFFAKEVDLSCIWRY